MGNIDKHNIGYYINKFNLDTFVETGTGKGTAIRHVISMFDSIYSIEIDKELFNSINITSDKLTLINDTSVNGLKKIIPNIKGKCLFWLDAHFPGVDLGEKPFNPNIEPEINMPLQSELNTIISLRNISNDVFIIDDLKMFEDGNFEHWRYTEWNKIDLSIFEETHDIKRDYRQEGYLIITPK